MTRMDGYQIYKCDRCWREFQVANGKAQPALFIDYEGMDRPGQLEASHSYDLCVICRGEVLDFVVGEAAIATGKLGRGSHDDTTIAP